MNNPRIRPNSFLSSWTWARLKKPARGRLRKLKHDPIAPLMQPAYHTEETAFAIKPTVRLVEDYQRITGLGGQSGDKRKKSWTSTQPLNRITGT